MGASCTAGRCTSAGRAARTAATSARDLLVHTLGITPAEPGYASVRIAPRLGDLAWARGSVPTPHGPVSVEVDGTRVRVDSPVPCEVIR
ncbi:alpha-L-rhamnosidase C-terminal domain-containing protein [Nonomuraea sediminis]|uniref:alpha-L-rhamnosidase C-terminal domain-containing protein n=1 Tax=Nonomuraea sediminis TaxID=2835864 RepID=UPI001BDBF7D2|nr:alpha-L-rhamnosidase C-terminal domain-containing protein [Nonomuraea sediminis]